MGDQLFSVFYKNPTAVFGNGTETGLFPFHNVPEGSGAQTFAAHFSVPREPVILIAGENQFTISVENLQERFLFLEKCRIIQHIINSVSVWSNGVVKFNYVNGRRHRSTVIS